MWMTKRTALKNRMLFRRISSVNRCRKNVLKEVSRTHPLPRKSLKRQRVRRSKIATRAQHSRAEPVAQVYIAELGKYDCRYHARVHFSCVICIAAAFQLLPLFIFSMFIFVYFFTQTDPTRTVQRSALCRSRRELSNEYLLAKIGVDTAENEPLEVWGEIFNIIPWCPYRSGREEEESHRMALPQALDVRFLRAPGDPARA